MNAPNASLDTRITTDLPAMIDGPIPVEPYVSAEFFEREREAIFKRAWLNLCRAEDLPEVGDFKVFEVEIWNASILLVRGKDGALRAFHNTCTHRGNQVAARYGCEGNTRTFVCGYHGWTFDLDGSLRTLPAQEYFPGVDKDRLGLLPVACEVWNGFVFVNWNAQPEWPLAEFLGGLGQQIDGYPFGQMERVARYSARVAVNWKTFIDAFHETYHVGMVHARSLPGCSIPTDLRYEFDTLASARFYPPHHSASNRMVSRVDITPVSGAAWQLGPSFAANEDAPRLPGTNPSDDPRWYFDINVFFPNFFVDVGPGWYFTYNFWPISVDQTEWTMDIYQYAAADVGQRIAQEHTKVLLRDLLYEDLSTMETTHRSLKSGALKHMTVGPVMEVAVRHQYTNVMRWVNGEV